MAGLSTKLAAEFIGTFLLVFTVGCNVLSKTPVWAPVSIACVLMVAIYALGSVSGANFNPAVSFSIFLSKKMQGPGDLDAKACAAYIFAQLFGGLVAGFSYAMLFWNAFNLGPAKGFWWGSAALCELLYTFMLCFVVLNVAVARKYSEGTGNQFYGLAIGFVIIAGAYGAGAVSGGCFNPAVAVGIDVSSAFLGFGYCVLYAFFEIAGAALATVAFKAVRPGDFDGRVVDNALASRQAGKKEKLISEFLGTFMLVLTVGLNVLGSSQAGAFSIAASLMCMIYALGDISGAHFNPAVTFAIFAAKPKSKEGDEPMKAKEMIEYWVAQIIGGVAASYTYKAIYWGYSFPLAPQTGHTWGQAAVAEIIFTFVLCFVVLSVACHVDTKSTTMFGLAIGSCVTVGGFAIGSISGGSLNPAVSFGIASCHSFRSVARAFAYSFFELLGAGLAAGVLKVTHSDK